MIKKILAIDDDGAIRKLFLLTLKDSGYQVDTAGSGEVAIVMVRHAKYHLIYLDLKMPGMDGVETLRELRKMDNDVPVYIITAFHEEYLDGLKRAAQDGIDFEIFPKRFL